MPFQVVNTIKTFELFRIYHGWSFRGLTQYVDQDIHLNICVQSTFPESYISCFVMMFIRVDFPTPFTPTTLRDLLQAV